MCGEPVLTVVLLGEEVVIDRSEAHYELPSAGVVLTAGNEVRPWDGRYRRTGDAIHALHECALVA